MRLKIILGYTIEYILFACYKDANVFLGYSYVWACAFWGIKGVKVVHSHPNVSIHPYRTCFSVIVKGWYESNHMCPFHMQECFKLYKKNKTFLEWIEFIIIFKQFQPYYAHPSL